ncbi:hypothetical protein GCM10009798_08430 [Nocardioides panacihumi]|uniref:Modulator of FtsH protease n=1 Tax=Nocardioides panacihumi TaxID=400774 RepID=A0ABN2QFR8_9ACTN
MVTSSWESFAVMVGGASGALTGLIFVVVSLDRDRIVQHPRMRANAARTLVLLILPLLVCLLILVPGEPRWVVGAALLAVAATTLYGLLRIPRHSLGSEHSRLAEVVDRRETSYVIAGLLAVAGMVLLADRPAGLYWIVPAIFLAILTGVLNAWLFLVGDPQGSRP